MKIRSTVEASNPPDINFVRKIQEKEDNCRLSMKYLQIKYLKCVFSFFIIIEATGYVPTHQDQSMFKLEF